MKRAPEQPTLDMGSAKMNRFEARKNEHGAWCVFFGDVNVTVCMNDRVARKVASQLNEDHEAIDLAAAMPAGSRVSSGAVIALSHGKDGGSVPVAAAVAYALHSMATHLRSAIEEPGEAKSSNNQPTVVSFDARQKGHEAWSVFFGSTEIIPLPSFECAKLVASKLNENMENVVLGGILPVKSRAWLWASSAAALISATAAIKMRDEMAAALILFGRAHDLSGVAS